MSERGHEDHIPHTYIGDAVYAEFDGFSLRLYTQQGANIWLEPTEWRKVKEFMIGKER